MQWSDSLSPEKQLKFKDHSQTSSNHCKPKALKPYPLTPEKRREMARQIDQMLKGDIIQEMNDSPWQAPVCLARKPNNALRFTVDMRYANSQIDSENCVIPTAQEVFDTVADAKASVYSTLDMTSSFWQIPLHSDSIPITTFGTPFGNYAYKRLPFGMKNSTIAFMSTMHKILRKSNFLYTLCYVDDVIIFSPDLTTHKSHLKQIFSVLSEAGFTLNPRKCKFAAEDVTYLGYRITKDGISMTSQYKDAVRLFPQPKNLKSTRAWLGLCNYYKRWCKNYSKMAAPLYALLKKDTKFDFNQECINAFNSMKKAMLEAPVLRHADFSRRFLLSTDASGTAISYILGQLDPDNNKEYVISYGGRALKAGERKWGITEREGLAVMEGIRHYRHYLQTNPFTIITDHRSLLFIQKIKDKNYSGTGRLGRWSLQLQGLDFDLQYKKGSALTNADALSRRDYPLEADHLAPDNDEILTRDEPHLANITAVHQDYTHNTQETKLQHITARLHDILHDKSSHNSTGSQENKSSTQPTNLQSISALLHDMIQEESTQKNGIFIEYGEITQEMTPRVMTIQAEKDDKQITDLIDAKQDLIRLQQEDEYFGPIYKFLSKGILPQQAKQARHIILISEQYEIKDGRLYHFYTRRIRKKKHGDAPTEFIAQTVIPQKLERDILEAYHNLLGGGHLGVDKTYSAIRARYHFKQLYQKVKDHVTQCPDCQLAKHSNHNPPAPLHPLPIQPLFKRWHVDCIGPLTESEDGFNHILIAVESYSKFPEIHPLRTTQASEIAQVLYKEVFTRYGAPSSLVSDRHQSFLSDILKHLCEKFKVKKYFTSSFHPESNATTERMNQQVEAALRIMVNKDQKDWPQHLPGIAMALRKNVAATGFSPFHMLHSQEMNLPIDTALETNDMTPPVKTFMERISKHQKLVHDIATTVKQDAQNDMIAQRAKTACEPDLKAGDKVKMKNRNLEKGKSTKLQQKWIAPYVITEAHPNHFYRLRNLSTGKLLRHPRNFSDLKRWHDKPIPLPQPNQLAPQPTQDNDNTNDSQPASVNNQPNGIAQNGQQNTPTGNNNQDATQGTTKTKPLPISVPPDAAIVKIIKPNPGKPSGHKWYNVKIRYQDGTTIGTSAFEHEIPQQLLQEYKDHIKQKRLNKLKRRRKRY